MHKHFKFIVGIRMYPETKFEEQISWKIQIMPRIYHCL